MRVLLFKPRFASLVESGAKRQTVRADGKRNPKPGDVLSLRTWTGLPYRSKQRVLRPEVKCLAVQEVLINGGMGLMSIRDVILKRAEAEAFAAADGFTNATEMFHWFLKEYGRGPLIGLLISWEVAR